MSEELYLLAKCARGYPNLEDNLYNISDIAEAQDERIESLDEQEYLIPNTEYLRYKWREHEISVLRSSREW
jgi:hypothetical protein